jgi:hydroxymethylglutaryl-CoA lyase
MADADQVLALLPRLTDVRYIALVPNLFGAERAVAAGMRELSFTVSASPTYNQRNVGMSVDESVAALAEICALDGIGTVDAVVSCAFGSPYEGDIEPSDVAALGRRLMEAGAASLTFADTTGMAMPRRIDALVAEVGSNIRLHLHETRGTGLVNAYAAIQLGVADFDTSVGGLGGSPFAAGAAGNLATEELVHLLDDLGVETGFDLDRLIEAAGLAAELVGHAVPSRVASAGPRHRLVQA